MKKLILSVIFALVVLAGFSATETKASVVKGVQTVLQENDSYYYVKVYENDRWWIYTYTSDGIFVSKMEDI